MSTVAQSDNVADARLELVATADRAIQPALQRGMAEAIKAKTIEVAASHVAVLARPEETAKLILEAAA